MGAGPHGDKLSTTARAHLAFWRSTASFCLLRSSKAASLACSLALSACSSSSCCRSAAASFSALAAALGSAALASASCSCLR